MCFFSLGKIPNYVKNPLMDVKDTNQIQTRKYEESKQFQLPSDLKIVSAFFWNLERPSRFDVDVTSKLQEMVKNANSKGLGMTPVITAEHTYFGVDDVAIGMPKELIIQYLGDVTIIFI